MNKNLKAFLITLFLCIGCGLFLVFIAFANPFVSFIVCVICLFVWIFIGIRSGLH